MKILSFLLAIVLFLVIALLPAIARADTNPTGQFNTALDILNVIQITDAIQTQTFLHGGRYPCDAVGPTLFQPQGPQAAPGAVCTAFEADPIARPFVGNLGRNVGSAIVIGAVIQVLAHILFKHSHATMAKVFYGIDAGYGAGVLVPNQRVIQAQDNYHAP
jgi:hypothetical protein